MIIYDCFTFYNEFELLELRLRELYDHVDQFVLVEADRTFQNKEKPLYFTADLDNPRWAQYRDKIRVVQVTDMSPATDAWGRERHQRDAIMYGCRDADPTDIIIISDVDEIPRPETVARLRDSTEMIWGFRMPLFNFKYNYMMVTQDRYSVWSGAVRRQALDSPEDFRRMRHTLNSCAYDFSDGTVAIVEHAGWHFTYLGAEEFARTKIQSFAHEETNRPEILDQLDIEDSIRRGTGIIRTDRDYLFAPVAVDDYLPRTILDNPTEFADRLIATDAQSARQYLPAVL